MKGKAKIRRLLAWLGASLLVAAAYLGIAPAPAMADSLVQGCHLGMCVDVYTGAKNYSNHTQWVSAIDVYGSGGAQQVQAWTYNFYQQANAPSARFWANRWVPSGNNVCGAVVVQGNRQIACIVIRV